ncbi:putative F-box protein At3g23970 [Quercus robur]|uniref:putative F-box protein At3g23970 n=1 Tax=Quercus robur TaxID=38942 RepID=UPI00216360AF|nr:putative F-box protein At3g23970 [Quercus robur]
MDIIVSPNKKPNSAMDTIASPNIKPNSVIDTTASPDKKPNSETKQTSFDDLSNDLLLEILHRLPLKPAHRFKCISKRWGYLISQPQFAQRFIQRMKLLFPLQSPPFSLFFQCYSPEPFPIEFKQFHRDSNFRSSNFFFNFLPPNPKPPIYLGSSNGLVLCSTTILYQKDYYVCNPLTGKWVFLPWPPYFDKYVLAGFVCYASYDDIDTINTQFKVVRVTPGGINQIRAGQLCVEIFSSDTSEWKQLIVHCEGLQDVADVTMFQTHPILAHNDVVHWVNHYSGKILACDPNDEHGKCRLIDLPNDPDGMYQHKCLSVCQGRLQCLIICEEVCQHMIHRWEFLEDEDYIAGKWSLVARIPVCKSNQLLRVIATHPVDPMILYLRKSKRIVLLNGHTEETDVVHYFAEDQFGCYDAMINAFQFVLQWWPTPVPELHKGITVGERSVFDGGEGVIDKHSDLSHMSPF